MSTATVKSGVMVVRVRGGGDATTAGVVQEGTNVGSMAAQGEGDDNDESRRPPKMPKRYEPGECTNEADLEGLTLAELINRALWHYDRGRHPTPSMFTKKGNLRAMDTSNGVRARGLKFVERETDPSRVRAKSESTAHAQDVISFAIRTFGQAEVVAQLVEALISAGPPDDEEDEVYLLPYP